MTKQDIISEIENAGYSVEKEENEKMIGSYNFINLLDFETTNSILNQRWFRIIENTQTEEAWWRGEDQLAARPVTFNQEVENTIQYHIDNDNIQAGFIKEISDQHRRATVQTVTPSNAYQNYLVYDTTEGLQIKAIS